MFVVGVFFLVCIGVCRFFILFDVSYVVFVWLYLFAHPCVISVCLVEVDE